MTRLPKLKISVQRGKQYTSPVTLKAEAQLSKINVNIDRQFY